MYKVFPSSDNSQSPNDIFPTASKTKLPPSSVAKLLVAARLRVGSVPGLIPKVAFKSMPVIV